MFSEPPTNAKYFLIKSKMEVEESTTTTITTDVLPSSTEDAPQSAINNEEAEKKDDNEKVTTMKTTSRTTITAPELIYANISEKKIYWDRSHYDSPQTQLIALSKSSTIYIGNLGFTTTQNHILSLFSTVGTIKKINIGLDRYKKSPCGFAFVEYYKRDSALQAVMFLSGCKLDGRVVRVELDAGFKPGRQYGRGVSGGQVRDDRRHFHDPARSTAAFRKQQAGQKRGRDDDDEVMADHDKPSSKNPRFQDYDDQYL